MIEIGRPARHTRRLRRTNLANVVAAGAVCVTASLSFFVVQGVLRWVMLVLAVFAALASRDSWVKTRKNQAGITAENLAAKHLRRCGASAVVFGAVIAHGDCDAVVLGPQLAAIEVKHGRGTVRMDGGTLRDDRRRLLKDPLAQATAQAAALHRLSGVRVDAIVCVTLMTNPPFQVKNTTVCSAKDLPGVIASLPARLGPEQANLITQKLAQAS